MTVQQFPARKRAPSGQGSIYFSTSMNRWMGAMCEGFDKHGRRRRKYVIGKTREEAAQKLQVLLARQYEHRAKMKPVRAAKAAKHGRERFGSVYFIGDDHGSVKVGYSADPEKRLMQIQTGHPHTLRLLGSRLAIKTQETAIHTLFCDLRLSGEWFRVTPALLAFIAAFTGQTT